MKIYSMTATFGKLENKTLTLQPGLNVIHAPNEWGKTTWCAFLVNMLYGVETRVKSTKTVLADKERYAPWSGSPMSGRIDLNWAGRDITVERWTKGRTPMGEFRAYETETGMAVPELTAATCGEQLLGVERSVFLRSGFLRLADLPVTDDEQLRRRLNALVTTGDESDAGDVLAQRLKELKNKVRYNRSGLLPAAEKEAAELEDTLGQIDSLRQKMDEVRQRQQEKKVQIAALENHKIALEYAQGEENNHRIMQTQIRRDQTRERLDRLEEQCSLLPDPEKCAASADQLRQLYQQSMALDMEQQMLPPAPEKPVSSPVTVEQASGDAQAYRQLQIEQKNCRMITKISLYAGVLVAVGLVLSLVVQNSLLALLAGLLLLGCTIAVGYFYNKKEAACRKANQLTEKYGSEDVEKWLKEANTALEEERLYTEELTRYEQMLTQFRQKREALNGQIRELTQGQPVSQCLQNWENVARQWQELKEARQDYENAKNHADMVSAMAKPLQKPEEPDHLTYSMEQTQGLLEQAMQEQQFLKQQQGNYLGRMESMGQEDALRQQLAATRDRIARLTETYAALELAQATLAAATAELQRRFAPRIAKEAQNIFGKLTDGRYDRLTISQDLSLQAGAEEESVLHTAQWRSEGTVDQMYFALRLAVSKALMPEAPLVLDDALVRFDDIRHAAAMNILKEEAENRQIILFTCQSRELGY